MFPAADNMGLVAYGDTCAPVMRYLLTAFPIKDRYSIGRTDGSDNVCEVVLRLIDRN